MCVLCAMIEVMRTRVSWATTEHVWPFISHENLTNTMITRKLGIELALLFSAKPMLSQFTLLRESHKS